MRPLVRLGATSALVAGALRVASAFIPYDPDSAALEGLYAVIDCGLLFGLIGVYVSASDRIGRVGLICFAVALAALASIIGPDSAKFGVDWYKAGAAILVVALAGLAACLLRRRILILPSTCWLGALAAGLLAPLSPFGLAVSGTLFGTGFLLAGWTLWRTPGAAQPA